MLRIDRRNYDALRRHGEETYPHECCGVLLGRMESENERIVTSIARTGNTRTDSPQNRYNINPKDLIRIQREGRERGEDIVGFYHSHPDHPAQWSKTDFAEAHWIGCSYVITSVEKRRATLTNSFALSGGDEHDKKFVDEEIVIARSSDAGPITISVATSNESGAIMAIINSAYEVETFIIGPRVDAKSMEDMWGKGDFLTAKDLSGRIIASVYVETRSDPAYFGLLAVDPAWQGKNLGRRMIEAAENFAREKGRRTMKLTVVNLRTELPPFYRKMGYQESGSEEFRNPRPLAAGGKLHLIVMSKSL
jgi:proteasome lid subunit RPN8/RPN11/GNAT superfamily N-acetyltransferase